MDAEDRKFMEKEMAVKDKYQKRFVWFLYLMCLIVFILMLIWLAISLNEDTVIPY
jgi:type VI protein secretion system component VasF